MNYIWEVSLEAKKQGKEITFLPAKRYSPYMEVSLEDLNKIFLEENEEIEVNPYYRFYSIFKNYFPPESELENDFSIKTFLFDLFLHYLIFFDNNRGNSKEEYYKKVVTKEIEEGIYGKTAQENFSFFIKKEKEVLIKGVLNLYRTGTSFFLFQNIMKGIFPNHFCYQRKEEGEILLYIGTKKEEKERRKVELIIQWFLPLRSLVTLYWETHFCVLGIENTSVLEEIALY